MKQTKMLVACFRKPKEGTIHCEKSWIEFTTDDEKAFDDEVGIYLRNDWELIFRGEMAKPDQELTFLLPQYKGQRHDGDYILVDIEAINSETVKVAGDEAYVGVCFGFEFRYGDLMALKSFVDSAIKKVDAKLKRRKASS